MNISLFDRQNVLPTVLFGLLSIVAFYGNLFSTGPVVQIDEIGYFANAAAFAGHTKMNGHLYRVIATNHDDWTDSQVIHWYNQRKA